MDDLVGSIKINDVVLGSAPCFIIAEAGVNHNGDLGVAHQLIDVAVDAGADAVKFQSFKADRLVTIEAPKATYQTQTTRADESQRDMLLRLELDVDAHRELVTHCHDTGIEFLSTPFDEESADMLEDLGVSAFKIPSGEITNLPFLCHVSRKGLPMIVSTGMAFLSEVEAATEAIRSTKNDAIILLHCVSDYPADPADANLRAILTMASAFGVPVGLSDHSLGNEVAIAAIALGARVLEKHFTLDREMPGPDHAASAAPDEFAMLVKGVRSVEAALGDGRKRPTDNEVETAAIVRKSLVAKSGIPAGTTLVETMLTAKRPGTGLPPTMKSDIVGRITRVDIGPGTLLTLAMLR